MPDCTIEEMIVCIDREIGFREKCYPRWVEQKKMLAPTAVLELRRMKAVRENLGRQLAASRQVSAAMP